MAAEGGRLTQGYTQALFDGYSISAGRAVPSGQRQPAIGVDREIHPAGSMQVLQCQSDHSRPLTQHPGQDIQGEFLLRVTPNCCLTAPIRSCSTWRGSSVAGLAGSSTTFLGFTRDMAALISSAPGGVNAMTSVPAGCRRVRSSRSTPSIRLPSPQITIFAIPDKSSRVACSINPAQVFDLQSGARLELD